MRLQVISSISQLISKRQSRQQLKKLPSHILKDIGLTTDQIKREMYKNSLSYFCKTSLNKLFNLPRMGDQHGK